MSAMIKVLMQSFAKYRTLFICRNESEFQWFLFCGFELLNLVFPVPSETGYRCESPEDKGGLNLALNAANDLEKM